jgi:hypothetical protein
MKGYEEVDVWIHIFLPSALSGGEWSVSRPGRFTPRERAPGTNWIWGWVEPRAGMDDVEKILDPTGTRTLTPRSSSPYTDHGNPAHRGPQFTTIINNINFYIILIFRTLSSFTERSLSYGFLHRHSVWVSSSELQMRPYSNQQKSGLSETRRSHFGH